MPNRFFTRLIVALALVARASPASAAVTLRGLLLDDGGPRPGWLERYQESRQGPETVDKTSQTFKVGAEGALDLTGIAGDVRVTGGSGNEIRVEATKRVRHRNADEAKRLLNELRVEMNNFNGRVEVRSVYPRRSSSGERNISARVDYVVAVPAGAIGRGQVHLGRRHRLGRARRGPRRNRERRRQRRFARPTWPWPRRCRAT